ncbi:hypothetical protein [Hyphomicrobium nitrativorans]|uniref:hypothetical protein n=1 Tax=Hyphomicrobium nitrativorans TaxID=1427356 RepID=UPI00118347FA|nr:hypothetical protein [Hyphomicrobium nitrativorans]
MAVPLLVAGGFATAALSIKLVELYGHVSAYAIMAVLFSVIALITMAVNNKESEPVGEPAAAADATDASQEADEESDAPQLPPEVMALLTSVAPAAAPGIARGVARNLPLIFLLAIAAFVISRFAEASGEPSPSDVAEADAPGTP